MCGRKFDYMETQNIKLMASKRSGAFTLIELLVVIGIIGIVAALVVNLSGKAATTRKIKRVETELSQLETVIDAYKDKKGFYPPSNGNTNNVMTNQLFYELSGTTAVVNNGDVVKFTTIKGDESITPTKINEFFGVSGFANSSSDKTEVKNFAPNLKSAQYAEVVSSPDEVELMVVPVDGPNDIVRPDGKKLNPWRYNSSAPVHNPESYDLWAEIVVGGKTNIIGNWKD